MVNIPPLPPLLSNTPPPIDFGDEEDLDILPSALDDVEDAFGDFLVDDGLKTDEPLPSPRPASSCDLQQTSAYESSIQPQEDFSNQTQTPSLHPPDAKNLIISKNLTETFNFKVRKCIKGEIKAQAVTEYPVNENRNVEHVVIETQVENDSSKIEERKVNNQIICEDIGNNSGYKDLKIVTVNYEEKCKLNKKKQLGCMQNLVSIEDIEGDLSDNELYSPKPQKNFIGTDNMTDFFKIEEIKSQSTSGNNPKLDSNKINCNPLESKDNNESASLKNENCNEYKSLSSNSLMQQNHFDIPSPSPSDLNSKDNDADNDFGDFADFQETNFVNNEVPKEKMNINRDNSDIEIYDLDGLIKYNSADSNFEVETNKIVTGNEGYEKMRVELEDLSNSSFLNKIDDKHEGIKEKEADIKVITQESKNEKNDFLYTADGNCNDSKNNNAMNENKQPVKQLSYGDNSVNDFSSPAEIVKKEDFKNVENIKAQTTKEINSSISYDVDNDEYNEFADFESYHLSIHDDVIEEDEDDFGDFNTAEPITITTPSSIVSKTSQNINPQTPVLTSNNLNERISKILQVMFTTNPNLASDQSDELKANKIHYIPFTSIDAAKALEYQWLSSDTRHSFIRSLGIDSRNILYGDNWNPSLPRFAANLSFNPLKPMKPVLPSSTTDESSSMVESIPVSNSETKQAIELSRIKKDALDLDWKSSIAEEQSPEGFKGSNFNAPIAAAAYMACASNGSTVIEPESLALYENTPQNDDKFSKTPSNSEVESVTSFSSHKSDVTKDTDLPTSPIELEENLKSSLNINEVVVTSTFTGSFKETHIYTPPMTNDLEIKHVSATPPTLSSSPTKSSPIDFDYEKAAMGVIIDETVVKKEYRDVEYNPPFTMDSLSKSVSPKMDLFETNSYINTNLEVLSSAETKEVNEDDEDANDDFCEFQSVTSEESATIPPTPSKPLDVPKTTTVSHGGMILSPAILIPQAISMANQKPKIEWGDSTATINPAELARIEELFPEPKSLKSANSSKQSTPTHQLVASTPSISATVANKELEGNINNINDDDEDWCDFVSVSLTNNIASSRTGNNNNVSAKNPAGSSFQQRSSVVANRISSAIHNNSNNDDEWSEFVSSVPPLQQPNACRVPQFNSGAWQNANFYNNPLSMYHKRPLNIPTTAAATHNIQKYLYNNNNNCNVSQQPHLIGSNPPSTLMAKNLKPPHSSYKQQIHVMQNFSTAPVPTPERLAAASKNNQFQTIGSAKVAPSIALIPDLGFVAPAIPTHTSLINSLPTPSINMNK